MAERRSPKHLPKRVLRKTVGWGFESRAYLPKDDEHPSLIICTMKGEAQLERAANELTAQGIRIKRFYEPDRNNEFTAFATEPLTGESRKAMRKFQLMRA